MFRFLPEPASEFAPEIDWLHNWITDLSVFFTVLIFGAAIYFAIRYRRKGGVDHATPQIRGDHRLEVLWTVIPTVVCLFLAIKGILVYNHMRTPPSGTLDINVSGRQWHWDFEYANGKRTTDHWVIPVNKPIRLIMRSKDVLHSFFLPDMRVKNDVLPSMYSYLWFKPIKTGVYHTYCTEYCGKDHSAMLAKLEVVSEAEYDRWLNDNSEELAKKRMEPGKLGLQLYNDKGCVACHSLDGSPKIGPSFKGIWGRQEELVDGSKIVVDENYVHESIVNPQAKVVKGFPVNGMTSFQGLISDEEINAIIAFLKDVDKYAAQAAAKAAAVAAASTEDLSLLTSAERGERIFKDVQYACSTCHSLDGSRLVGPSLKGVFGRVSKFADGTSATIDEAYIKESLLNPSAKIVDTFGAAGSASPMPSFQGRFSEEQLADIVAYLKTLK